MSGVDASDEFGQLLRELKDRSGLSYGVLAKRLHMSTSTLHRYCNGDVVPTDYAPVERLARLCKASPEELVELHRRWVLADAVRERKGKGTAAVREAAPEPRPQPEPQPEGPGIPEASKAAVLSEPEPEEPKPDAPEPLAPEPPVARRRLRRPSVLVSAAAFAGLGAVVLAWQSSVGFGGHPAGDPTRESSAVGTAAHGGGAAGSGARSPSGPAKATGTGKQAGGMRSPGPGDDSPSTGATATGPAGSVAAVPLTVNTRPYAWEGPCSQHYLIDRPAQRVSPPPAEQDAPGWVSAFGAVSSGEQYVALAVQGTGKDTVVLEDLQVRVVSSNAPLAWNDYGMGDGCGGGVPDEAFNVDLDAGRPAVAPAGGQRDFPFKVSETDPEVFHIRADTAAHDVSWYLELNWSSGARHGTVRIDDHGEPFRTSGNAGRPSYDFPLGGNEWIDHASENR
ncbi:helix-turn-helix transcriptional regulator [Streptomyces sp. NPDC047022]|uniref:helix-turn-helix domain-containing protein n=1 Tax=Streptomyces sp. NPDC047022 TaxID=3155737 RepID=UPI0033C33234